MSVKRYFSPAAVMASAAIISASPVFAGIVINGTRIVYSGNAREQTTQITNLGKGAELIQVWIDSGDPNSTPENSKAPFVVSPPLFRLDPNQGQGVRIVYTKEPLPSDKESVFYFNALEIPAKPANSDGKNLLQFAFRTRIKLFFRPPGLAGDVADAPGKLSWKLVDAGAGGVKIRVTNPSSYYVNFLSVALSEGDKAVATQDNAHGGYGGMVAPGGYTDFTLIGVSPEARSQLAQTSVAFTVINDAGGRLSLHATLAS